MSDIGTAYVQIVPAATGITNSISQTIAPGAAKAGTMAGQTIASNMGSKLSSIGGGFMKAGAIATAVAVPIVAGIKKSMDAYQVQSAAETKLVEIYKSRMGASKKAAQSTMDLASALQREGVVGDEVQLSGAQQLATFAKYPSTVNSLLPAMNNLLVQQKGLNGTTQDATQIANLMGKVMMGQTGALKRVGVSFTEAEEKVLKYGTEEEKAAMLSKVITNNVGEMNKAMLKTPEGKIQQMKNAMGDLSEQIGGTLAPVLADVAKWISSNIIPKVEGFIGFLKANPIIAKITLGIAGLLSVGGPLLIIIGSIISAIGAIIPVLGAVTAPMLAIPAAIGAVVAALIYAYNSSETFRTAVNSLFSQIMAAVQPLVSTVITALKQIISAIGSIITSIASGLAPVINGLTPVITAIVKVLVRVATVTVQQFAGAFQVAAAIIKTAISMIQTIIWAISQLISKVWNAIRSTTRNVWQGIGSIISSIVRNAKSVVDKVVSAIKTALSFNGLSNVVRSVFNTIKSVITTPIDKARDTIKGIIEKIKGLFKFKVSFPNIPVPHFTISPPGWKMGDLLKGKIPHLGIKVYAKGGIVDDPTLGIFGEAGPEANIPLKGKAKMRPFAKAIAEEMGGAGTVYNIGDVTLDVSDLKDVATIEQIFSVIKRAKSLARG